MERHHRFQHLLVEDNSHPSPAAEAPLVPAGFMICPLAVVQAFPNIYQSMQFAIYQHAMELAKQMARPSILDRDLLGVWN